MRYSGTDSNVTMVPIRRYHQVKNEFRQQRIPMDFVTA